MKGRLYLASKKRKKRNRNRRNLKNKNKITKNNLILEGDIKESFKEELEIFKKEEEIDRNQENDSLNKKETNKDNRSDDLDLDKETKRDIRNTTNTEYYSKDGQRKSENSEEIKTKEYKTEYENGEEKGKNNVSENENEKNQILNEDIKENFTKVNLEDTDNNEENIDSENEQVINTENKSDDVLEDRLYTYEEFMSIDDEEKISKKELTESDFKMILARQVQKSKEKRNKIIGFILGIFVVSLLLYFFSPISMEDFKNDIKDTFSTETKPNKDFQ